MSRIKFNNESSFIIHVYQGNYSYRKKQFVTRPKAAATRCVVIRGSSYKDSEP